MRTPPPLPKYAGGDATQDRITDTTTRSPPVLNDGRRRLLALVRLQEEDRRPGGPEARMPATLAHSELLLPSAAASDLGWWSPPVDVREHPARYTIVADLPGVEPTTLEVTAHGNVLTITGARRDRIHTGGVPVRLERPTGKLRRSLQLPNGCDGTKIRTRLRNGVLEIEVSKPPTNRPSGHEHEGGDQADRAHRPMAQRSSSTSDSDTALAPGSHGDARRDQTLPARRASLRFAGNCMTDLLLTLMVRRGSMLDGEQRRQPDTRMSCRSETAITHYSCSAGKGQPPWRHRARARRERLWPKSGPQLPELRT